MPAAVAQLCLLCFCFTVSASLRILNQTLDCAQPGLANCTIGNCSKPMKVRRLDAPVAPEWGGHRLSVVLDRDRFIPVLNVSWTIPLIGSFRTVNGSQIHITDERTNQTMCWEYSYKLSALRNPHSQKWGFSLYGVVAQLEHSYGVTVYNLPEPNIGHYRITKSFSVPGCEDSVMKNIQECRENGSLWEPLPNITTFPDWKQKAMSFVISFYTSEYSERYDVILQSPSLSSNLTLLKENRTLLNVTFHLSASQFQCDIIIKIVPFFKPCHGSCWSVQETLKDCIDLYPSRTLLVKTVFGLVCLSTCWAYFLWRTFTTAPSRFVPPLADDAAPRCGQTAKRKRLLIVYSLDHPLYKNIILKLCSFLMAKCGTEVVLDLLDSTRLGMMGGIQWLEWHRQQIEASSDRILVLCSKGVQAKWRAMCSGEQVQLKEDTHSTVGDMLVPALSLMVPQLVKSTSFEKYIIAYFDGVSTEEDVPSPFLITVRYKLMKQFEELCFRILDCEKHQVGRVNRIEGVSETDYHLCPTGKALRNAIEDFQVFQEEHPRWFEEELIDHSQMDVDKAWVPDSDAPDMTGHVLSNCATETAAYSVNEQQVQLCIT